MSLRLPFKLLEITVRSAQDLPPISKLLRTYAVASIHPDHKFTTRVDRQGHTNPTWNEKFTFRVDEKFLNNDTSTVTIEIYSVSWLRDIPIGNIRVLVNDLIPPSLWFKKNSSTRFVSLQISRPSGHLQGTLNIGVNLVDCTARSMPLSSEQSSSSTIESRVSPNKKRSKIKNHSPKKDEEKNAKGKIIIPCVENKVKVQLMRSESERTVSFNENLIQKGNSFDDLSINGSEFWVGKVKNGSICSYMRPLPSDLVVAFKKGLYSTTGDELGSSIFEDWTVAGDFDEMPKWKVVSWTDEITRSSTTKDREILQRHAERGGGLFSCFSIVCGYECNILCGTPSGKKKKKKKRFGKGYAGVNHEDEKFRRFHINSR